MQRQWVSLLLAWACLVVCPAVRVGRLATDNVDARGPPLVNPRLETFEAGAAAAKIGALTAKTAAAVSRARASAAQASTSRTLIENLKVQNMMKEKSLKASLADMKASATASEGFSKEAVTAQKATKVLSKSEVEDAKVLAVKEVQNLLVGKYKELESWRHKVLDNPYQRAKAAGAAAAKPYFDMVKTIYARIGAYQAEAGGMMSQANSAAADSQALANGAQGRMDGGDTIGAGQDIETAKSLRARGDQLSGAAKSLQGEAVKMNDLISQYIASAHMAAWRAEYAVDPDVLPAPPVNPDKAYTPPPPPAA